VLSCEDFSVIVRSDYLHSGMEGGDEDFDFISTTGGFALDEEGELAAPSAVRGSEAKGTSFFGDSRWQWLFAAEVEEEEEERPLL
jgi:hypothetical protein